MSQVQEILDRGFIQPCIFKCGASVLFVKKKVGNKRTVAFILSHMKVRIKIGLII